MNGKYMLDENNNPVEADDIFEWSKWFETGDRDLVQTRLKNGMVVSTVFLGLDHRFMGEGKPILWESMIFNPVDGDDRQERYTSHAEAMAGHLALVAVAMGLLQKETPRKLS